VVRRSDNQAFARHFLEATMIARAALLAMRSTGVTQGQIGHQAG
jgi:hypothetical protein